jgi:hypothetical protein
VREAGATKAGLFGQRRYELSFQIAGDLAVQSGREALLGHWDRADTAAAVSWNGVSTTSSARRTGFDLGSRFESN